MDTPKVPFTITYRHAGTEPPIFVAGEFSDPHWEPQEMEYITGDDGEHTFKKQVYAVAGSKIQYKFRVGLGDWWVLNENAPTAMDAGGFLNNVAEVPRATEQSDPAAAAERGKHIASKAAGTGSHQNERSAESSLAQGGGSEASGEPTMADAAKELRHRLNPHPASGAGTPDFVRTAAEVADSAKLLDRDEEEPPAANAAQERMNRLDPHASSGTTTPDFVKTTAEVADSAALLDNDDPEIYVTDEEAGKIGYRRMSLTPIQDVAATAAEVADTAESLDSEPVPRLELRPTEYDSMDPYGFDEPPVPDNKAPLFAHECVGMELYEGDDPADPLGDEHYNAEYEEDRRPSTVYDAEEDIDLNDPTLEKFPSNREEIIDTVRKLEGGLNEDHSDVEGLTPLSPVVGPSGPQNHDMLGDFLVSSPAVASPVKQRGSGSGSRHLGLPRASLGSISSDRSSALSLGSISEAEEVGPEDEAPYPPVLSAPKPRKHPFAVEDPKSPTSDDDEGIVMMKASTDRADKSREVSDTDETAARSSEGARTPKPTDARTGDNKPCFFEPQPAINLVPASSASSASGAFEQPAQATQNGESGSPHVVTAQKRQKSSQETENNVQEETATSDRSSPKIAATSGNGTANDRDGAQSQLRRRAVVPDRVATPSSQINDIGAQAAKSGSWFRSFFRMIFVDWIGGFVRRLCGGSKQRET